MLRQFLDTLDLNSYEKEIIIYLVQVDSADAKTIYQNTKIPKGRIYSVLQELKYKDFIEIIPTSPKRYQIEDIRKSLKNYLENKSDKIKEDIDKIKDIKLKPKKYELRKKDPSVHCFTGRNEHLRIISSFREDAKKELLQMAPLFKGAFSSNLALKKALDRKIDVKIIILKITEKNKKNVRDCISLGGQVRTLDTEDLLSLVIKDRKEFLIGVQDYRKTEERLTLLSKNKALLDTFINTFERLWKRAKEISDEF